MRDNTPLDVRLLRIRDVASLAAISQTHVRRLVARGDFPKPVEITAGRVAWVETEVRRWIADRIAARDRGVAA